MRFFQKMSQLEQKILNGILLSQTGNTLSIVDSLNELYKLDLSCASTIFLVHASYALNSEGDKYDVNNNGTLVFNEGMYRTDNENYYETDSGIQSPSEKILDLIAEELEKRYLEQQKTATSSASSAAASPN